MLLNWRYCRLCLEPDRWLMIDIHLKGRCPVDLWKSSPMNSSKSTLLLLLLSFKLVLKCVCLAIFQREICVV